MQLFSQFAKDNVKIIKQSPDIDLATLVTASGFSQSMSPELREDVRNHIEEGRIIYSVKRGETLVGYALFRTVGPVLYLSGIMLSPEIQGKGFASKIIGQARKDSNLDLLGLRTQSLYLWVAGSRTTTEWFPRPFEEDNLGNSELDKIRVQLAKDIGCGTPRSFGYYGKSLYGEKPIYANSKLQTWWDNSICDIDRGDAVVCLGRMR